MPRVYYTTQSQAEEDSEAYDEYYDYSQLRSSIEREYIHTPTDETDPVYSVLYNAPWPLGPSNPIFDPLSLNFHDPALD